MRQIPGFQFNPEPEELNYCDQSQRLLPLLSLIQCETENFRAAHGRHRPGMSSHRFLHYQLTVAVFTQVIGGSPSRIIDHESPLFVEPKTLPLRVPK